MFQEIFPSLRDELLSLSRSKLPCEHLLKQFLYLNFVSNQKPILHFNNDCINHFNQSHTPIGIKVNTIDEYVDNMIFAIENYEFFKYDLSKFQKNIIKLREIYKIENSIDELRKSFTWKL